MTTPRLWISLCVLGLTGCSATNDNAANDTTGNGGEYREYQCGVPFAVPSSDGCDSSDESWDYVEGITLEQCQQRCEDDPDCSMWQGFDYNPETRRCLIDASCTPETLGYRTYAYDLCDSATRCEPPAPVDQVGECTAWPGATQFATELPLEACSIACRVNNFCEPGDVILYSESAQTCIIHPGCIDHPGGDYRAYRTQEC